MTNKLKPCPFCGNENIDTWNYRSQKIYCTCEECLCKGPSANSEKEAIEAWNRRAGED